MFCTVNNNNNIIIMHDSSIAHMGIDEMHEHLIMLVPCTDLSFNTAVYIMLVLFMIGKQLE